MDRDRLFIETLRDLKARSWPDGQSEYEILRAGALLRQLLIDDSPLLHQVNRERRVSIRFRVNVREPLWKIAGSQPPVFWSVQDGFDPETTLPNLQVAELDLDAFLARVVMSINGIDLTVKDIVKQASHVSGAVHAGAPRDQSARAMADLSDAIRVGGYDPVVRSLQAIGRVVVKALDPLREEIED